MARCTFWVFHFCIPALPAFTSSNRPLQTVRVVIVLLIVVDSKEACASSLDVAILHGGFLRFLTILDRVVVHYPCADDVAYSVASSSFRCDRYVYFASEPIVCELLRACVIRRMESSSFLSLPISVANFTRKGICIRATCGACTSDSLLITPSMLPPPSISCYAIEPQQTTGVPSPDSFT